MDVTRIYLFGKEQHVLCYNNQCPGAFWEICPRPSKVSYCGLCMPKNLDLLEEVLIRRAYARWK